MGKKMSLAFLLVLQHGKLNCHDIFVAQRTKSNQKHLVVSAHPPVSVTRLTQISLMNDSQKLVITTGHDIICFVKIKETQQIQVSEAELCFSLPLFLLCACLCLEERTSPLLLEPWHLCCALAQKAHQLCFFSHIFP